MIFPAHPGRWEPGVGAPEMAGGALTPQPVRAPPPEQCPAFWALLSLPQKEQQGASGCSTRLCCPRTEGLSWNARGDPDRGWGAAILPGTVTAVPQGVVSPCLDAAPVSSPFADSSGVIRLPH